MLDPTNPEYYEAIKLVLIASDTEYKLWPQAEVEQVRRTFMARRGQVLTLEDAAQQFDVEKLNEVLQRMVSEQHDSIQFSNALQSVGSPCHACGSTEQLNTYDFGLAKIIKQERDWSSTGISAAVSAVTIPLLGTGALYGPSKTKTAQILRMKLMLCRSCIEKRKGIFGGFKLVEEHCRLHLVWSKCQGAGFTKFIGPSELSGWH